VKLSEPQRKMLVSQRDCGNATIHLKGSSAMGGAHKTYRWLLHAGLMDRDWYITDAGRAALQKDTRK
jgi:hypothetical protein